MSGVWLFFIILSDFIFLFGLFSADFSVLSSKMAVITTEQYWSLLISRDHYWSVLLSTDPYRSLLIPTDQFWSVLIRTDRHWSVLIFLFNFNFDAIFGHEFGLRPHLASFLLVFSTDVRPKRPFKGVCGLEWLEPTVPNLPSFYFNILMQI